MPTSFPGPGPSAVSRPRPSAALLCFPGPARFRDKTLVQVAEQHSMTPAQVVLRWHLQHRIPVIPKSADPERIAANVALFDFSLSDDEMARLDGLSRR